jgi:hypothetical protein
MYFYYIPCYCVTDIEELCFNNHPLVVILFVNPIFSTLGPPLAILAACVGALCRIVAEVSLFRAATLESSEKRDQDEKRKRKQVENAGLTAHPAKFRLRTKTPVPQEIEDIS